MTHFTTISCTVLSTGDTAVVITAGHTVSTEVDIPVSEGVPALIGVNGRLLARS